MSYQFEHTDTFAGESNYSWVNRTTYEPKTPNPSDLALVRAAKKWAGFNGIRCRVDRMGDMIAIWATGYCQVVFITWND